MDSSRSRVLDDVASGRVASGCRGFVPPLAANLVGTGSNIGEIY